ncbi:MAG: ABC transporter permease, partial [Bacilli bacterium]
MKQFLTVLKFELSNYFQKKSFIISTVIIALAMIIGLSLPNFIDMSAILPPSSKNETKLEEDVEVETTGEDKTKFAIYNTQIEPKVEILGKDSANNYFYAYILIFVIYMMIIMYGQLIAMAITAEKSNRAIEVLVTSTNTNNLIFGKVIAGAIASIVQVGVVMSSGIIAYKINSDAWNGMLDNIFKIPSELIYTFAIFGILGYLFYTFIFGALGALVSKTEEIGTSVGPI